MFSTTHNAEKEVKIELGILPQSNAVSDFDNCNIEMAFLAKDKSFTQVNYLTRKELELLMVQGDEVLAELDRQEAEAFLNQSRN